MDKIRFNKGISTSIRFSDRTKDKTYDHLNSSSFSNFNAFVEQAINNQVIIDQGSTEEKLKLLGLENILDLLTPVEDKKEIIEKEVVKDSSAAKKSVLVVDEEISIEGDGRPSL